MNLKENYERYFGKIKPLNENGTAIKPKTKTLTEEDVQKWQKAQKTINNQFPGTTVSVLGKFVYLNNHLVETTEKFFQRSLGGMIQTLKATRQKLD